MELQEFAMYFVLCTGLPSFENTATRTIERHNRRRLHRSGFDLLATPKSDNSAERQPRASTSGIFETPYFFFGVASNHRLLKNLGLHKTTLFLPPLFHSFQVTPKVTPKRAEHRLRKQTLHNP